MRFCQTLPLHACARAHCKLRRQRESCPQNGRERSEGETAKDGGEGGDGGTEVEEAVVGEDGLPVELALGVAYCVLFAPRTPRHSTPKTAVSGCRRWIRRGKGCEEARRAERGGGEEDSE
eukprot:3932849-Rhodomonas_salina.2